MKPILYCLFFLISLGCGKTKNASESIIDSLNNPRDSMTIQSNTSKVTEIKDPNVYDIPSDYSWLRKFIGNPFPWDTVGMCMRAQTFATIFTEATVTKKQIHEYQMSELLITLLTNGNSYIRVAEFSGEGMQDCGDNICKVVLTSDWVPLAFGLHVGMSKSEFLNAIHLDKNLNQNIYHYAFKPEYYESLRVTFEFKNDLLSSFSYELFPCNAFQFRVPDVPSASELLSLDFFNKPFLTNKPDSVQRMIKTNVSIVVVRDNIYTTVDKLSESDMSPEFKFDSSSIKFEKWPKWQIVYADIKSPNFSFVNGLKVGMKRADFLRTMGESDFEGDKYHDWENLVVNFKDGVISSIKYSTSGIYGGM